MASARDIVRRLIENTDDPEDLDSPESFGVSKHIDSPVARLASVNGFTEASRYEGEERWVKPLSDGREAWLRTTSRSNDDFERPMDPRDPQRYGGREWEFVVASPVHKCDYCNQDRPPKKGLCPHCKKSRKIRRWTDQHQIARGSEMTMNYLLGAILQRLATWPQGLPKPGQRGWKKAFENLGVDDPEDMLRHLKAQEGCPHCGCPDYDMGSGFVTPNGSKVQNVYCQQCARCYVRGEEKTRIVRENEDVDNPDQYLKKLKRKPRCPECRSLRVNPSFISGVGDKATAYWVCMTCGKLLAYGEHDELVLGNE